MSRDEKREKKSREIIIFLALAFIEIMILSFFISMTFSDGVFAGVGRNATVKTLLEIGNVQPEIINLTVYPYPNLDLIPNSTANLSVVLLVRDFNGEGELFNVSVVLFDSVASSLGAVNDNNTHYYKNCTLDFTYPDQFTAMANCTFEVWYYANNATWNVTAYAYDNYSIISDYNSTTVVINTLLAVGLPDSINYGRVNATQVSNEVEANVSNFGNVDINLSLSGYAVNPNDGWAMNCSLGSAMNISIMYEKYNLSTISTGYLTLSEMEQRYINLTSEVVNKTFNLKYRKNDSYNEAFNSTYWRIYVPRGVAGNCSGNIVFGAMQGFAN